MTRNNFSFLSSRTTHLWCLVWYLASIVSIEAAVDSTSAVQLATNKATEAKNTRNCKALCDHCGCLGFYCGEECICECNKDHTDTNCITTMQSNARKLDIPFEILIQGPTANRFVRDSFQFEQNEERRSSGILGRSKRSTVVIYKPSQLNALASSTTDDEHKISKILGYKEGSRQKRAVNNLEWFTDLANTLVRPAPLNGNSKDDVGVASVNAEDGASGGLYKRAIDGPDRSWFTDNANLLLKPSPLFKRQRGSSSTSDSGEVGSAMRAVEKFPQVLQDTLRNIKESTIAEEFTDAVRTTIRDGTEALQKSNLEFIPSHLRNELSEALTKLKSIGGELDALNKNDVNNPINTDSNSATSSPEVRSTGKFNIPWFRPVRFLSRVRQAINNVQDGAASAR